MTRKDIDMTSLKFLQEIDAWLSFNNSPSKEQISELRKDIKNHIIKQFSNNEVVLCGCNNQQPDPITSGAVIIMKDYTSIKGLINKDALQKSIAANQDGYGGACVNVAINVMKHLDDFDDDFNIGYNPDMTTPHGIICKCDDQGGITGFMAGAARNIVANCHILGWKFYIADVLSPYDIDRNEAIEKAIKSVVDADND
jgi:flavodoxin